MTIMNVVILDANFIMVPSQFLVDIYQEIRMRLPGKLKLLIVPEVLEELTRKLEGKTSTKYYRQVKLAIQLLEHQQRQFPDYFVSISKIDSRNIHVDDYLLNLANKYKQDAKNEVFIATNDAELRKKMRTHAIRAIYLRQKKYIEITP